MCIKKINNTTFNSWDIRRKFLQLYSFHDLNFNVFFSIHFNEFDSSEQPLKCEEYPLGNKALILSFVIHVLNDSTVGEIQQNESKSSDRKLMSKPRPLRMHGTRPLNVICGLKLHTLDTTHELEPYLSSTEQRARTLHARDAMQGQMKRWSNSKLNVWRFYKICLFPNVDLIQPVVTVKIIANVP